MRPDRRIKMRTFLAKLLRDDPGSVGLQPETAARMRYGPPFTTPEAAFGS